MGGLEKWACTMWAGFMSRSDRHRQISVFRCPTLLIEIILEDLYNDELVRLVLCRHIRTLHGGSTEMGRTCSQNE
jgi:hypothetical protein